MKRYTHEHSAKAPKIVRLEVGSFKANCYLVYDTQGDCVIIDPGEDADFIEEKIREFNLVPKLILLTHGHSDHVSAVADIALAYGIAVHMNKKDVFLLRKAVVFAGVFKETKDGEIVNAGEIRFRILEIPGHTPGSIALQLLGTPDVFCGDIFFSDGSLGRTDFGYSDRGLMAKSIKRLKKLSKDTRFYPGHGEEFTNL